MTQMTAQVFFVTAQAKDAVQVPIAALRPVRSGERRAKSESANSGDGGRTAASGADGAAKGAASERSATSGGAARGAGGSRGAEVDPRIRFAGGRAMVRVVKADGAIEDREVKVGVMSRISAQIVSGLEPGEQVITGSSTPRAANAGASKGGSNNNAPKMQPRI
jgi:macrolide-specific efflux system membrane fusion protein